MHLCRSSSNVPCLPSFLEMLQNPHVLLTFEQVQNPLRLPRETTSNLQKWSVNGVFCTFWLGNVLRATTACTFSTSQLPKVVRSWCVLYILTWKCASRHNGVHFFDISTSKSGPTMVCFMHFDFEMCFAPQRRALFRHLNFQKSSGAGVFCTFWLGNVLRATTACTFSTSQLPKVVRQWCVLCILTSKCASRHNGVHFFDISTSKSRPELVCFVHFDLEMCFAPQRRALFRHLNFQKWSDNGVFCAFWLRNVLRATTVSIYLSARSKTKKFCETSFMFEHNNVQNETIVRDVLIFWTWQHPKRSNSARLPHFSKFKTSKTKEFCETSFKNGKLSAKLPASYQCVLRFFQSTCLKYCACHGKLMPGHTTCRTCHAKSS